MLKHLLAFVLLAFLSGVALADEAQLLRIEAVALIHAADNPDIGFEERQVKLQEAYQKLIEIEQNFPSANSEIQLYRNGARVRLSSGDVLNEVKLISLGRPEVGKLRDFLGRELSPDAIDENGWTDLHFAAALNLPELASVLLDMGARVDAELVVFENCDYMSARLKEALATLSLDYCYSSNSQPLHIAARENAFEVAAVLIDRGADVHAEAVGVTPLHEAALGNALEVAAVLIDRGADVNATVEWSDTTPLHNAAISNASEIAATLIEHGADVNAKSSFGTPLREAIKNNSQDTEELLRRHNAHE